MPPQRKPDTGRFDWKTFLRQHGIPYITTGPNASRGHVNIKCPFCGSGDPSEHMGISLYGKGWSCWRNKSHRGSSRSRLIQALLRCSADEALRLSGGEAHVPTDRELSAEVRSRLSKGELHHEEVCEQELVFPREFKVLEGALSRPFRGYLRGRGYRDQQIDWLADAYDLRYAVRGKFAYRIVIPVRDRWGKLLTWTGRSILEDEELRYLTLQRKRDEVPRALADPKEQLLGLEMLWNCPKPQALFVSEGPFDAMWVTTFGRQMGVYGTCLFGLEMSEAQAVLLDQLRDRFPHVGLLLDGSARMQAFRMAHSGLEFPITRLPPEVKDPAELSPGAVLQMCLSVIK